MNRIQYLATRLAAVIGSWSPIRSWWVYSLRFRRYRKPQRTTEFDGPKLAGYQREPFVGVMKR